MIGPMMDPVSAAIWNAASAGPPLRSRPTTSATAACWAGLIDPDPKPAITETTTRSGRDVANPVAMVASPEITNPAMMKGRRPTTSERRPAMVKPTAFPAAKTANAVPAIQVSLPMTAAAKRE